LEGREGGGRLDPIYIPHIDTAYSNLVSQIPLKNGQNATTLLEFSPFSRGIRFQSGC